MDAFAALCRRPGAFWLDSGDRAGPHARFHHLGSDPAHRLSLSETDPFDPLEQLERHLRAEPPPPRAAPRAIGYLSYDLGRFLERVPCPGDALPGPETYFAIYDAVVSIDLRTSAAWITAESDAAAARLEARLLAEPAPTTQGPLTDGPPQPHRNETDWRFIVERALEYIAAGDVYQTNLSHRFEARLRDGVHASDIYRRLRARHSACYGAYLDTGDTGHNAILSNSPEGFLDIRLDGDRRVITWPLKGTRARGADDLVQMSEELRNDPKERAEHLMIVDLERNDLGRIAIPGTVGVPRLMEVVEHPTVLHLESRVEAVPRPDIRLVDVLRATFPGGSITGAPKIRAMEIIAELEQERRGIYCGALGAIGWGGRHARFSIPIRTAHVHGRRLSMRSGGGIVADSDPAREHHETLVKARAFLDILG